MRKTFRTLSLLTLIAGLLTGCSGFPALVPESGPSPAVPQPEQIVIFDGVTSRSLGPGDAAYAPIARKLAELIAAMDTPIYAYYPPERVATEIMPVPHLEARYGRNVTLVGKGYQVEAERLIVVIAHDEKIILTHTQARTDWDACETSQPVRFDALLKAIKDQTGANLSP